MSWCFLTSDDIDQPAGMVYTTEAISLSSVESLVHKSLMQTMKAD